MAGCFSWCPGSRKATTKLESGVVTAADSKHSKEVSAIPTTGDYVLGGSAKAVNVLKAAVDIVGGVPGAQGVLELALVLIETCQDLTEIEDKVLELKDHIESITLVMVKAVEGKESASIPQDLLNDIEILRTNLGTIKRDLDKIATQNKLLVVLFKSANKAKVDRCMELLKNSLVHWDVSRDISQGIILHSVEQKVDRVQETVNEIQTSMNGLIRRAHTAIHAPSRQMPQKPSIFSGRDQFVDDIAKIFTSASTGQKPPRICIHGPGGVGKTSAAIAVMEHPDIQAKFAENDRFWVPCVSATSPDILLHILYLNLRISRDTGDYLADIMTELQSSTALRLMLLDNFETPWDPIEGTKEDVEKILRLLSSLSQLSILVTMRTNILPWEEINWVDKPLNAVDPEASKKIYCAIHSSAAGKPKLDELLVELSHMPFAIRLVATLGKCSKSTPEALLKNWRKHGPGMLNSDESVEDSISRSIGLSMNSKTIVKNVPARTLFAALAMLPAGTTHSRLDWWVPELGNKRSAAIKALNNVALIVDAELDDSEVAISALPVVQSYMRHGQRIPTTVRDNVRNACYKLVLEHKSSPGDPTFKDDLLILSLEQTNIQSILLDATRTTKVNTPNATLSPDIPDIRKVLEVLVAFCWFQHWTKPRTEVIEHTLKLAHKAELEEFIAECLFCLGSTFFRLDKYEDAEVNYAKARDYYTKLSNVVRASECSFELADLYLYMSNSSKAGEALNSVSEKDMDAHAYVRARGKMARGKFYWYSLQHTKALEYLTAAKEQFETQEINKPVDAAYCLHSIARALASMKDISGAVKAVDQSLDIYEKTGPDNRLAETLLVKDYILLNVQAPADQVLPTLQRTLQKSQELGRPLAIAQALEMLGEFHALQRDVRSAIEYYQAAQAQYETIDNVNSISRCQHSCRELLQMEVNPDLQVEWHGQRLSSLLS